MAGKIFVSYRRDDAKADARDLHNRLCRAFGGKNVFMDVDNLLVGQRFDEQLDGALSQCDVLLAVIGPRWMDILAERDGPDDRDYVRDEIVAALKRKIAVIPVLVDGAELPPATSLPDDIRDLIFYQKQDIAHETFGRDVDQLVAGIKAVRKARAKSSQPSVLGRVAAVLTLAVILGSGGYLAYNGHLANMIGSTPSVENDPDAEAREAAQNAKAEEAARIARVKAEEEKRRKAEEAQKAAAAAEAKRRTEAEEKARVEALRREVEENRKAEAAKKEEENRRKAEVARKTVDDDKRSAEAEEKARDLARARALDEARKRGEEAKQRIKWDKKQKDVWRILAGTCSGLSYYDCLSHSGHCSWREFNDEMRCLLSNPAKTKSDRSIAHESVCGDLPYSECLKRLESCTWSNFNDSSKCILAGSVDAKETPEEQLARLRKQWAKETKNSDDRSATEYVNCRALTYAECLAVPDKCSLFNPTGEFSCAPR